MAGGAARFTYWKNLRVAVRTLTEGLTLTLAHFVKARKKRKSVSIQDHTYFDAQSGIATVQYPHETIPVPDTGRYQLHNEMDDCIVCDKCVKICPVDCITIEPIRAVEEFGKTSDGTPRRLYAARFDIDMGKCCFCGLCTTVCPTECLTMTKTYDFSVFDIRKHNFEFGNMSQGLIEEKKREWETHQQKKSTAAPAVMEAKPAASQPPAIRPAFKPRIKPPAGKNEDAS